ncbi:MAG: N-acetylmuramic acid 6-phosphate etherase, partial [Bacteroidales bacterium]
MAFDRITEQSSLYDNLQDMSAEELLCNINAEDRKVATAVERTIPQITTLVEGIIVRMKQGGRIFYLGAGTSGRLGVLDASEIPPTYGMPPTYVVGIIAGGYDALRRSIEGAEDDYEKGWNELL